MADDDQEAKIAQISTLTSDLLEHVVRECRLICDDPKDMMVVVEGLATGVCLYMAEQAQVTSPDGRHPAVGIADALGRGILTRTAGIVAN